MNPLEAHRRLLQLLPVRTHIWQPVTRENTGRPTLEQTKRLHQAIVRLTTQGFTRSETAKQLGIDLQTVRRHCAWK